jgi:E3 ubiquitin-protein ligase SHPRH
LPYSHKTWWERLLFWPYIRHGDALPLINLLSQIFWRNAKSDVADELQLPALTEETNWLKFSSTEAFFYQRQQESCLQEASKVIPLSIDVCRQYKIFLEGVCEMSWRHG